MLVYDKAHELASAIRESKIYLEYKLIVVRSINHGKKMGDSDAPQL